MSGANFQFWRCPYGLKPLCDYGLQARFIQSSYPSVDSDTDAACQLAERLVSTNAPSVRIGPFREERRTQNEISLHRLGQLGLVAEYHLEYQGLERAFIHVGVNPTPSTDDLDAHLREAKGRIVGADPTRESQPKTEAAVDPTDQSPFIAELRPRLHELISETYRSVKLMRYRMLMNLLSYTNSSAETCRRIILRAPFDPDAWTSEHRCEFCDICVPDLLFERDRAIVHEADVGLSEVARRLPGALQSLDPDELELLLRTAAEHRGLAVLQARVEHTLESQPTNIAAHLLAGRAASERAGDLRAERPEAAAELTRQALRHLVPAFQEAEREQLTEDQVLPIYRQLARVDQRIALDTADYAGGILDTISGHRRLLEGALALGERDRATVLTRHIIINELSAIAGTAQSLATRLKGI